MIAVSCGQWCARWSRGAVVSCGYCQLSAQSVRMLSSTTLYCCVWLLRLWERIYSLRVEMTIAFQPSSSTSSQLSSSQRFKVRARSGEWPFISAALFATCRFIFNCKRSKKSGSASSLWTLEISLKYLLLEKQFIFVEEFLLFSHDPWHSSLS